MGLSKPIAAGAVICGAYFGDKMTPLSETTILVPQLVGGGLTVGAAHPQHVLDGGAGARDQPRDLPRASASTPTPHGAVSTDEAPTRSSGAFNISALNLLPLALLVVFTVKKAPPFLAILGSALFAGILACFTQWDAGQGVRRRARARARRDRDQGDLRGDGDRLRQQHGVQAIDELFSRGGMASLLTTVWLVLAALSFAAILEHAGLPGAAAAARRGAGAVARPADPGRERERRSA